MEWGEEHIEEHTRAREEMEGYEQSTGITYRGGKTRTTVMLENDGKIAYELQNLTLNAFLYDPARPLELGPLGTLTYAGGTYRDSLDPGEVVTGLNFEASVDLPTIRKPLENSRNLVIQPTGVQMRGLGDIDFTHATTDIASRTAQIVIDFGLERRPESYRVATTPIRPTRESRCGRRSPRCCASPMPWVRASGSTSERRRRGPRTGASPPSATWR